MDTEALPAVYFFVGFLVLLVGVLWVLIPFAVFGIKPLLREILAELRKANARPVPAPAPPAREKTLAELVPGP
jgi:hypothetical protein